MEKEKNFSISYSASNKKTIKAGSFEVTLFEPLEKICDEVVGLVMAEIKLKNLTGLSITIKEIEQMDSPHLGYKETAAEVPLTKKELKLIASLKKLAKRWNRDTDRLWLYSGSGTLHVMMYGDSETNPEPEFTDTGGVNPDNQITYIDIPNDGGDW